MHPGDEEEEIAMKKRSILALIMIAVMAVSGCGKTESKEEGNAGTEDKNGENQYQDRKSTRLNSSHA